MLRSLFGSTRRKSSGANWQNSKAHLLLLSKFLEPQALENFAKSERWEEALKESSQNAIERFLSDGMIAEADLSERLRYKFKVSELKSILKKYNLPVSGRKDDLVERLVQTDSQGMNELVADFNVYRCTEQGRKIAEQYLYDEKEYRNQVEQNTKDALLRREFREASQFVAAFEAEQVFQRGINSEWENYDSKRDVAVLRKIFDKVPKALSEIGPELLEELQVAAGMMHLWGTNRGTQYGSIHVEPEVKIDSSIAINMIHSHAINLCQIADYKRSGVKKVRILNANDPFVCDECKKLAGKDYGLNQAPNLPYEKCTCEFGCRCWIIATEY